jgi:hypothetical protein
MSSGKEAAIDFVAGGIAGAASVVVGHPAVRDRVVCLFNMISMFSAISYAVLFDYRTLLRFGFNFLGLRGIKVRWIALPN